MDSVSSVLHKYLSKKDLEFTQHLLYGPKIPRVIKLEESIRTEQFDISAHSFCEDSTIRKTKVGLFQHAIPCATYLPIEEQIKAVLDLGRDACATGGRLGVQIMCFQEIWNMPVAFCTQKKLPWVEFAEDPFNGPTSTYLRTLAKFHEMVIISPILERDEKEQVWNSAVVINSDGQVLGVSRKNHIPISGMYSETYYCNPSTLGHPVFQTKYARIAVSICYERHHPQSWFAYGVNQAEIVFNPSATVKSFSECLWPVEARDAAVQNGYYTCAINRVGTERFQTDQELNLIAGPFFGSSYITAPDGSRTPGLAEDRSGLLVADLDLGKCLQKSAQERIGGFKLFQ